MSNLQQIIENAFEKRAEITPKTVDAQTRAAIEEVIEGLDCGKYRVAEKIDGEWVTHQWLKKAVLLSFRINENHGEQCPCQQQGKNQLPWIGVTQHNQNTQHAAQ